MAQKSEKKCKVIYPLAVHQAQNLPYEERKYDFCFISTQFRIKGGPEAVHAFERVRARAGKRYPVCVVTNLKEARDYLGNLNRYPGVEWHQANLSQNEIANLLANSRCFVHPSMADSFGVVVLEALAASCAIIVSGIASFPEMVQNGSNGYHLNVPFSAVNRDLFMVEFGNADYLSQFLNTLNLNSLVEGLDYSMSSIIENENITKEMMVQSNRLFKARFSEEIWMQSMIDILQSAFPEYDLLNKVLNMKRG